MTPRSTGGAQLLTFWSQYRPFSTECRPQISTKMFIEVVGNQLRANDSVVKDLRTTVLISPVTFHGLL